MTRKPGEFSVFWWDCEDNKNNEMRFVDAETAVRAARRLTCGPAATLGMVNRVIITDEGDCIAFEWIKDKGIVFPPQKELQHG